jgi:transposase, IS5 family
MVAIFEKANFTIEIRLDKENRWVKLAGIIPWNEPSGIYYKKLSKNMGAPTIDARIVIGSMIVKHKLGLDDRETIETIRENMYIQYFLGLSEYTYEDVFDRSLFTKLRCRMGVEQFDAMSCELISGAESSKQQRKKEKKKPDNPEEKKPEPEEEKVPVKNQGKLLLDATVADQMIVHPTDLGLVAKSREQSERIIDLLCQSLEVMIKPRTYRRKARKQ